MVEVQNKEMMRQTITLNNIWRLMYGFINTHENRYYARFQIAWSKNTL